MLICLGGALAVSGYRGNTNPYIDFSQQGESIAVSLSEDAAQKPLRVALASVLSPQETIGYFRQIAVYLSQQLGRPVVLVQRKTYEEVNLLMANDEADVAFLSTGAYSAYRGMTEIEMLVMQERGGDSFYMTYIIVHKDSKLKNMQDLRGKVFAFTDPLSFSGHLAIVEFLKQRQDTPEKYFGRYIYTYSQDKSCWAVANKVVDAASIDSQILEYAQEKTPELAAKLVIIETMGPAPTGPVVMRKSLSPEQKEHLREIFLGMNRDPVLHQALQGLMIDRFVSPLPELYEPLRKLYDRVRG